MRHFLRKMHKSQNSDALSQGRITVVCGAKKKGIILSSFLLKMFHEYNTKIGILYTTVWECFMCRAGLSSNFSTALANALPKWRNDATG